MTTLYAGAQAGIGAEVQLGVAGMHFQPNELYTSANTAYVPGFALGAMLDAPVTGKVYLQAGVLLSRKGDDRSFSYAFNDSFHESVSQKFGLGYAEIPLDVTLKTGIQGKGRLFFTIGIKPSYLVYGTNTIHANGTSSGVAYDTTTHSVITDGKPLKRFEMSLILAAGYELPTGWFLKFVYAPGITDLGQGGEVDKNRTLSISAGRYLGKKRDLNKEVDDLIDHGE